MSHDIYFAAAACKLATALHHARAEACGIAIQPWHELSAYEQHELVDHAADVLDAVKPPPPANVVHLSAFLMQMGADSLRR